MQTRVLPVETVEQFQSAVAEAVALLRRGELVALPTETVYGLAANALDANAVKKIYEVKGRPIHNPVIVHVASLKMAKECVAQWSDDAETLARHFWPGPLTLVLPKAEVVPAAVTAGGDSVGVRLPSHPLIRRVIEGCEFPLAAPSANLANQLSPTTAKHVVEVLSGKIPLVVDTGPTSVGIESTVLDLTGASSSSPTVLRPGMISTRQLRQVLGREVHLATNQSGKLKSPGLLKKHYSPKARMIVRSWKDDAELNAFTVTAGVKPADIHIISYERIPESNPFGRVAIIPHDEDAYARAIYAELYHSDQLGAKLIIVEQPPSGEAWEGIRDRLRRASAYS